MESSMTIMVPETFLRTRFYPKLYYGVVYWYKNVNEKSTYDFGKYYVGCTSDEKHRRYHWNSYPSPYAGTKIDAARKRTPKSMWQYNRFFIWDEDPYRFAKRMAFHEALFIASFDSYKNGYNSNRGGAGRPGTVIIKVTSPTGESWVFFGYNEAGRKFDLTSGGVQRYVDKKGNHTNKAGFKFERLN